MDRLLHAALGHISGPRVAARFTSKPAQWAVLLDPGRRLGEAYMDGAFVLEQGSIAEFIDIVARGRAAAPPWAPPLAALRKGWRRLNQLNGRRVARANAAHHYDLDGRLYSLFLDSDRQYSCGYFEAEGASLDDAQLAKKRHLAAKLLVGANDRVLDIGSGWGGLALYLAEICGSDVIGITLSREQLAASRGRAAERGLAKHAEFKLTDYRDMEGRFDRIVSVMFEHVGVGFYDTFFRKCAALLAEDGVMVLHSIGRSDGPSATNPWVRKYIFPGGYIPALSEVLPAVERSGLLLTDTEILRLHYADTLAAWRDRFLAHREDAERIYDARFVRMWEFYLACAEAGFRHQNLMVFQIQLAKRHEAVPITRDYITRAEARLREREQRRTMPVRLAGE